MLMIFIVGVQVQWNVSKELEVCPRNVRLCHIHRNMLNQVQRGKMTRLPTD